MKKRPRGSAYVLVLFVLLVLNIMFMALMNESRRDKPGAHQFLYDTQAFYLAQAGLQKALHEIESAEQDKVPATVEESVRSLMNQSPSTGTFSRGNEPLGPGQYSYTYEVVNLDENLVRFVIRARGEAPRDSRRPAAKRVILAVYEWGKDVPFHMVYWKSPHFRPQDARALPPPTQP